MAPTALLNAYAYIDGYDATGDSNDLKINCTSNPLDKSNFRSGGWEEVHGGARKTTFNFAGWWSAEAAGAIDAEAFNDLGVTGKVFTTGAAETEGAPAQMFRAMKHSYQAFGGYGTLAPFSLTSSGSDGIGLIRGQLAKAKGSVSATGAIGTALNLGNVGASQFLYATLHILPTAGTTITVVVESDDNPGFTTATTRITFGPLTATGGTWGTRVAGALTETHYRLRVTAITGTFSVAGAIAIQ